MAKRTTQSSSDGLSGDMPAGTPKKPRTPRAAKRTTQSISTATADDGSATTLAASNGTSSNGASGDHPAIEEPAVAAPPQELEANSEPTEEEIRYRAYLRFLERGGGHGYHLDDWVHAERELRGKR